MPSTPDRSGFSDLNFSLHISLFNELDRISSYQESTKQNTYFLIVCFTINSELDLTLESSFQEPFFICLFSSFCGQLIRIIIPSILPIVFTFWVFLFLSVAIWYFQAGLSIRSLISLPFSLSLEFGSARSYSFQ
jgi:hypothetical protein